jgi:sec-independent protein translocase protein TatA
MGLGNLGPFEIGFLLIFLLLIFGAKRLPELGSGLGKGIREFKKSMREINSEIERPADTPQVHAAPPQSSIPSQTSETSDKA